VVYHRPSIFGLEALKIGSSSPQTQNASKRTHLFLYFSLWIEMLEASSTVHPQHSKPTSTFYAKGQMAKNLEDLKLYPKVLRI
jgi:hypothetical protein